MTKDDNEILISNLIDMDSNVHEKVRKLSAINLLICEKMNYKKKKIVELSKIVIIEFGTRWYFADSSWMPAITLIAIRTLNEDTRI